MVPRGLAASVGAGAALAAALGLALGGPWHGGQADGPSISVEAPPGGHAAGEPIPVTVSNTGTEDLRFADGTYGLGAAYLFGAPAPGRAAPAAGDPAPGEARTLAPGESAEPTWAAEGPGAYRVYAESLSGASGHTVVDVP